MKIYLVLFGTVFLLSSCNNKVIQKETSTKDSSKEIKEAFYGKIESDNMIRKKISEKLVISILRLVGEASRNRLVIELEVKNQTDEAKEICKYHSPFEGRLTSGLAFEVLDSRGIALPYEGMMIKREPPSRQHGDYLLIEPDDSVKASVDISKSYHFSKGKYRIKFVGTEMNGIPSSNAISIVIE